MYFFIIKPLLYIRGPYRGCQTGGRQYHLLDSITVSVFHCHSIILSADYSCIHPITWGSQLRSCGPTQDFNRGPDHMYQRLSPTPPTTHSPDVPGRLVPHVPSRNWCTACSHLGAKHAPLHICEHTPEDACSPPVSTAAQANDLPLFAADLPMITRGV